MMAKRLSDLEQIVMDYVWAHPKCSVDECRQGLIGSGRVLKDSTIRTLLHRLEKKGYVLRQLEGRIYLYQAGKSRRNVAAQAVKQIVDRFCEGSLEQLLVGMVDHEVVSRRELGRLAQKIALGKLRKKR